jgi:hypothetical protein
MNGALARVTDVPLPLFSKSFFGNAKKTKYNSLPDVPAGTTNYIRLSHPSRQGWNVGFRRHIPSLRDGNIGGAYLFLPTYCPSGTTSCVTAGRAQRNPWRETALSPKSRRDGIMMISPLAGLGCGGGMSPVSCAALAYGDASSHACGVSTRPDSIKAIFNRYML